MSNKIRCSTILIITDTLNICDCGNTCVKLLPAELNRPSYFTYSQENTYFIHSGVPCCWAYGCVWRITHFSHFLSSFYHRRLGDPYMAGVGHPVTVRVTIIASLSHQQLGSAPEANIALCHIEHELNHTTVFLSTLVMYVKLSCWGWRKPDTRS